MRNVEKRHTRSCRTPYGAGKRLLSPDRSGAVGERRAFLAGSEAVGQKG